MSDVFRNFISEINACEKAGAINAALAMCFIAIDTMTYLSLPTDKDAQTRDDFIVWTDTYLKCLEPQCYNYRGVDVYGARCAYLHLYGSESDFHKKNPNTIKFGYHDGGQHFFNSTIEPNLVLIGIPSFCRDVSYAIRGFLEAILKDSDLKIRVTKRLPSVIIHFPFPENEI